MWRWKSNPSTYQLLCRLRDILHHHIWHHKMWFRWLQNFQTVINFKNQSLLWIKVQLPTNIPISQCRNVQILLGCPYMTSPNYYYFITIKLDDVWGRRGVKNCLLWLDANLWKNPLHVQVWHNTKLVKCTPGLRAVVLQNRQSKCQLVQLQHKFDDHQW